MTEINWSILGNALNSNPGRDFTNAFQQGATQSGMALASQGDPRGMNALMQFNPQAGMAMQEHGQRQQARQQQQLQAQLEQHRERIVMGGRLVQQYRPTDQAGWDRVRAAAQTMRIDLSDVPEQFDPAYAEGLVNQANVFAPQREQQGPNIQREAEYYRSIGRPDLAQQLLVNHAEGSPVVFDVNGDGAPDLVPRSYFNGGGAQPQAPAAAPPPGFVLDGEGGAGPAAAPATFQQPNEFYIDPNQWQPTDRPR